MGLFHVFVTLSLKGTVHPKKLIQRQVVPNLYEFLSSVKHTKKSVLKNVDNQTVNGPH